jgi:ribosomal protein S27AE
MDMSNRYCSRCGNEVTEGKRFCKKCGHDVIAADSVHASVEIHEPARDDQFRVPFESASADNRDVAHHAQAGASAFSSSPVEQVQEKQSTPPAAVLAHVPAPPSSLPRGQSKQSAWIVIGIAALVVMAACGFWAWYAQKHRGITSSIKAASESQSSTTPVGPTSQSYPDQGNGVTSIEGKYPFDVIKMPWFKSKLAVLLNDKSRSEFSARLQVASPVERQG